MAEDINPNHKRSAVGKPDSRQNEIGEDFLGIPDDEFADAPEEPGNPAGQQYQPPLPIWFKALGIAVISLPILFFIGRVHYDSHENIKQLDWQKFMDEGCHPTFHGKLKKFFYDELDLWVHTNVSMESWKQSTEGDFEICNTVYSEPSQVTKRLQCLARFESKADWYSRCKPVVVLSCDQNGGACR